MTFVDKAARVAGIAFLLAAVAVVVRPGAPLRAWAGDKVSTTRANWVVSHKWDSLAGAPALLGMADPDHRVVEFIDYRCRYCKLFGDTASAFLRAHPQTAFVIRHLPRPGDSTSRAASLAAICAVEQGRFPAMHGYLLTDTLWAKRGDWNRVAVDVGLKDPKEFHACRSSARASAALAADIAWADRLSLRATPVFASRVKGLHIGVVSDSAMSEWLGIPRR